VGSLDAVLLMTRLFMSYGHERLNPKTGEKLCVVSSVALRSPAPCPLRVRCVDGSRDGGWVRLPVAGGRRCHGNQRELVEVRRLAKERRHAIDTARGGKSSSH